ncbi:RecB family exonuclease [Corynebacterium sp. sy017]|uniref:RecB family exonuclease n=1 Tax=unclassified Corynebacterium TaxID=2624378 RepID=UPI001184AE7D|nr:MULTISPECIES: RecB family exonuclease [unclassified Corynebacterium]MBP3087613.1 RecB family exonuclease [Corynebacterium sp. sy017]TSD92181.1 RecB family exonuclease [Corynebacterium sp. SY003]
MNNSLALSPSRAIDYRQCPLRYRFRVIDKLPEPKTIPQVMGNLVHSCLEDMHSWDREERTYPAVVKRLKPNWEKMCTKDAQLLELVPEQETYDFLVQSRQLLKGYFYMENPQAFDAHACELYVDTQLPNGVPVRGFIDRIDIAPTGEVRVVDYKTGKKPKPQYAQSAQFQMLFYALVYWRIHGVIPTQLRLMYLKVHDSLFLTPSKEELEYFEKDLAHLWGKILADVNSGDFRPHKTVLCGWCHFQKLCPAFGGVPPEYPGLPVESATQQESTHTD